MPEQALSDLAAIARTALLEITADATIGAHSGSVELDGVTTVTFESAMAGYPGWHWTVGIATLPDTEPSVLEVELMPGDGALLSPDWVPWSDRLAEYEAAQEAVAAEDIDDESTEIGPLIGELQDRHKTTHRRSSGYRGPFPQSVGVGVPTPNASEEPIDVFGDRAHRPFGNMLQGPAETPSGVEQHRQLFFNDREFDREFAFPTH